MPRSIPNILDDPLARIGDLIDFRCGTCKSARVAAQFITGVVTGAKGIVFTCHGESEFLELSEAQIANPRRLKGYRPFSGIPQEQNKRKATGVGGSIDYRAWSAGRSRVPMEAADLRWWCGKCSKEIAISDMFRDEATRQVIARFRCHNVAVDFPVSDETLMREGGLVACLRKVNPFPTPRTPSIIPPMYPVGDEATLSEDQIREINSKVETLIRQRDEAIALAEGLLEKKEPTVESMLVPQREPRAITLDD